MGILDIPFNSAIISIVGLEDGPAPDLSRHKDLPILRLGFSDVEELLLHRGKEYRPMNDDEAMQIIEFVEKHRAEVDIFVVRCCGGVSRSASVAMALHKVYGAKLPKWFHERGIPKEYVISKIVAAHARYLTQHQ